MTDSLTSNPELLQLRAILPERLRSADALQKVRSVRTEAADEIERLRAEALRAYDRGHRDGALGVTTLPPEYACDRSAYVAGQRPAG